MEALSSLPHELTNALDDFIKTLEGFTNEPPKCPGLFSDWAEKHSVTMIKAARRIYDDRGQTLPTLPDEPEFSYVIATHYLVVYARNLEILSENVNGLTTWEPIQRLDIPWYIRARALVTAMVGLFPQVSLNKLRQCISKIPAPHNPQSKICPKATHNKFYYDPNPPFGPPKTEWVMVCADQEKCQHILV